LIEADLPANVVDIRLRQAQEIIEELLKPVVCSFNLFLSLLCIVNQLLFSFTLSNRTKKMQLIFSVFGLLVFVYFPSFTDSNKLGDLIT
jgi:hypothetical protein